MDISNLRQNRRPRNLGEQSEALYGGDIRPIRRDRYGEPVEPTLFEPPAITPEMRAERYYRARQRADRIIPRLTDTELDAVEDAVRAQRGRRMHP